MFGSVGKVDVLACKGLRFVIQSWLEVMVSNVRLALWRELDNNEWEAGVKKKNGSPTVCESNTG